MWGEAAAAAAAEDDADGGDCGGRCSGVRRGHAHWELQ